MKSSKWSVVDEMLTKESVKSSPKSIQRSTPSKKDAIKWRIRLKHFMEEMEEIREHEDIDLRCNIHCGREIF